MESMSIIVGRSHRQLGERICSYLSVSPEEVVLKNFNDGEVRFKVCNNIRGKDVFIIQSTNPPADNILELLLIIDAVKRASAERITAVIPYFGYARQDRKDEPRVPISAKLIANLIVSAGADRVLTMELHSPQEQGFFDIPVDNLWGVQYLLWYLRKKLNPPLSGRIVVVSPDVGGVKRIDDVKFAEAVNAADTAIIYKRREKAGESKSIKLIGNVEDATTIIFDDIVDTAGTLTQGAELLVREGAQRVLAYATHPLLSSKRGKDGKVVRAVDLIRNSPIEKLVVLDTVKIPAGKMMGKIESISPHALFAIAIKNVHIGNSVGYLFSHHEEYLPTE